MNRKVFTIILLTVFMLAQFSVASAAVVDGDASVTSIPDFANAVDVDVDWAVTGMAAGTKNVLIWSRIQQDPAVAYANCDLIATIIGTSDASGTFTYAFAAPPANGAVVEFIITVDDDVCGGGTTYNPVAGDDPMGDVTVDTLAPTYFAANPPSMSALAPPLQPVACNTFEYWAMASDHYGFPSDVGFSGIGSWNQSTTGTFAPPPPVGPAEELLSWPFTFPATATGAWTVSMQVEDQAGNQIAAPVYLRNAVAIDTTTELAACATFSDVSGHEDEIYIRYLAELGLISGFADGTFGPDSTLTRAEAATLFEISNGYNAAGLPGAAPSAACTFSDVSAADWFAGWVWQACADGFMNGIGDGKFDPNNLLTRGQIVTIFNNVANANPALFGGFIDTNNILTLAYPTVPVMRIGAWLDVPIGAYYAVPVQLAYGWGVADGTSDTTFSPDEPATRGEYVKMLYRALSRV